MRKILPFAVFLAFSSLTLDAVAQQKKDASIYLKSKVIGADSPLWKTTDAPRNARVSQALQPYLGIIRFDRHPGDKERAQLREQGVHLEGYIPNDAWVAIFFSQPDMNRLTPLGCSGILELTPELKTDPQLLNGNLTPTAAKVAGMADLQISFTSYYPADSIKKWLQNEGVQILSEDIKQFGILNVRLPVGNIRALSALHYITYIQEVPAPDTNDNYKSSAHTRANFLRAPNGISSSGLTGRGVVVGVGDDTDPVRHIDFAGRLINRFDRVGGAGHGLHVMGIAGGAGIVNERALGFAPESKIVSHYFSNILAYSPVFHQDFGMRLTNNSYGQTITGDNSFRAYDIYSAVLDQMTDDLPDLLHIFAAGNSGNSNYVGPYHSSIVGETGFGTIHRSYQSAKNVLVVGNIDSVGVRAPTSSKGPVADGRLKPEIVAQGTQIYSASRDNLYGNRSGTSMASPAVTGGAALLLEQYARLHPGAGSLSAALLKALLCNGATDLGLPGPDYTYGYGNMNLLRSSEMLKNNHFTSGQLSGGQSRTINLTVPPNTAQLKVMLSWTDAAGHPLSSKALVNDLDLRVESNGSTVFPFINSTIPAQVRTPATRGIDRLNNIEQVVIDSPQAGSVNIIVDGFAVPSGPQEYFVVYDFVPAGTTLTAPAESERYVPGDKFFISWDSFGPTTGFHLEYFDGDSWTRIVSDLPATTRQYYWTVPSHLSSASARVRVIRTLDGEISSSGNFVVIGRPVLTILGNSNQCEGLIAISWTSVPDATGYELMKLEGNEMKVVASTPASELSYNFTGLSKDSTYWVSVRALKGEGRGLRAIAKSRIPEGGNCGQTISNGDLSVTKLVSPSRSGRLQTASVLKSDQLITIRIKNLDNATSFSRPATISYQINDAAPVTENITVPVLASLASVDITFNTRANLSGLGDYEIKTTLSAANDLIPENNTLVTSVSQLPNSPIALSLSPSPQVHIDDFSDMTDKEYYFHKVGPEGASRYDFESDNQGGRMRFFVNSGLARSGNKAVTLDANAYPRPETVNLFTGTYNLSDYNVNINDIRLDFWYMQHGQETGARNKVWVRGNDQASWIEIFNLLTNQSAPGYYRRTPSIELNDYLRANGQNFSSSTQIRWGQEGKYQAATAGAMNGYTFDDIRLSLAQNDVQLREIAYPQENNCGMGNAELISVKVYNSMLYPLSNISISYQINNGAVVTETIPSINADSEILFTFTTPGNFSAQTSHNLKVWTSFQEDSEPSNNELTRTVFNTPLITQFPYIQNFEADNGSWRTEGTHPSWEYGTPASTKISRAASGTKAWKTRLAGNYNDDELSYLYSPCFNIDGLARPTLSFMLALDVEDCGGNTFCDGAWVEYSYDGVNWSRLGLRNQGTNWYNRDFNDNHRWSQENYTRWHVATIQLPASTVPSEKNIRLRFVMSSDISQTYEGIAIDDVHIYDRPYEISTTGAPSLSQAISSTADVWTNFTSGNSIIASLNPKNSSPAPGIVKARNYIWTGAVQNANNTYYHNRSFVIQPSVSSINPGASVRLYFTDAEMEAMLNANTCTYCANATSVADLGISKYSNHNKDLENGTIADNAGQTWEFIPPASVAKVPFDKGYYVEFTTETFSEFWLSPAAIFTSDALPVKLQEFTASKMENEEVLLKWVVSGMTGFSHFEIERAIGNEALKEGNFRSIGNIYPRDISDRDYRFTDLPPSSDNVIYYRLKMIDLDGSYAFSDLKSVISGNVARTRVYPNPSKDGIFFLSYQNTGHFSYRVIDIAGRLIKSESIQGDGFSRKTVIDLKELGSGSYLIEVVSSGEKSVFRVIRR